MSVVEVIYLVAALLWIVVVVAAACIGGHYLVKLRARRRRVTGLIDTVRLSIERVTVPYRAVAMRRCRCSSADGCRKQRLRERRSVDDLVEPVSAQRGQPITPFLKGLGCQSRPVKDLFDNDKRCTAAIRAGRIAGELLVGDIGVVLEFPGRFDAIHPRLPVAAWRARPPALHR